MRHAPRSLSHTASALLTAATYGQFGEGVNHPHPYPPPGTFPSPSPRDSGLAGPGLPVGVGAEWVACLPGAERRFWTRLADFSTAHALKPEDAALFCSFFDSPRHKRGRWGSAEQVRKANRASQGQNRRFLRPQKSTPTSRRCNS